MTHRSPRLLCLLALASAAGMAAGQGPAGLPESRRVAWADVRPLASRLEGAGVGAGQFADYVDRTHRENMRRVREGDLDHLVFYMLQSTRITGEPPIEPALSARALVDGLDAGTREAFLRGGAAPRDRISAAVRSRAAALLRAFDSRKDDARLAFFRALVDSSVEGRSREAALLDEYLRAMRFVYLKEFVAQKAEQATTAVAELYRTRGLSTDTAVEAGYVVYLGLGVLRSLEPARRIRRVLIVGPGMDLAPRTALVEDAPPESYQPWAVIDALVSLGLATLDDLKVVAADINPRVVAHLRGAAARPPALTLVSEIQETATVRLTPEYREYFAALGKAVGEASAGASGPLQKTVRVQPAAAGRLTAVPLDIVTERLTGQPFDLVVATNILPYFDDVQLALAMSNVAAMLAPRGVFLHNEARPLVGDLLAPLGVAFEQSRHAVIANVTGSRPLFDSVFLHVKR